MSGIPIGLDFGAVMMMGVAQDADLELLSDTLPDFEAIVINALAGEPTADSDEEFS